MTSRTSVAIVAAVMLTGIGIGCAKPERQGPLGGHMMSRWAEQVSPDNVWPEYPRPQMVREQWTNLNGLWDYAIVPKDAARPEVFDGEILVPFCVESALSGVMKNVTPEQELWYRRTFDVPGGWQGQRVLLHFGAVDWHAVVYVNGAEVGRHTGGYDPFSFDVTDALASEGPQEVAVSVWDPTDTGTQPRGKQVREPSGIWYTSVTGIWRTVWLEPVPEVSIGRLQPVPDIDNNVLRLTVLPRGAGGGYTVKAVALDGGNKVSEAEGPAGEPITLPIRAPKLWSPDSPHLYDLKVTLTLDGETVDEVASYFGMRKISLGAGAHGHTRLLLNNEPVFQLGPLDQGWWPGGLYTAPTDEALRYDIEVTKELGFNMARKHVKVEPARWYYHCDKLGLMVWQDMPNGNLRREAPNNLRVGPSDPDANREPASATQFEAELKALVDNYSHFPSIVFWVLFNEGWGQYDTERVAGWVKQYDPSRLVNATSGWTDRGAGDVYDTHMYPGPGMEDAGPGRATVLGEFGGLGWPVPDHLWWDKRNWGYRTYQSREELNGKYDEVVGNVYGLLGRGLSAAIYTQTTDVEGEVNGLMTYDRAVVKFDAAALRELHGKLYEPAPAARVLVATSEHQPQTWSYTFTEPAGQWTQADFEATGWQQGAAPFQTGDDPLFPTGTVWSDGDIWARRVFTLDAVPDNLWMEAFHIATTGAIYINGVEVENLDGTRDTRRHYRHLDLSEHAGALQPGRNVIAVHCAKDKGLRGIDAGLYAIE